MENEFNMESGNLLKKIIVFTIPIILSSILQLLFNAVDLIVVSKFSNEISLAAVGSTSSLINLIVNVFIGVSVGANVAVARGIGKKDYNRVHKLVHTAISFSIIAGILLMIFGIIMSEKLLIMMGTTAECLDLATVYLKIYFSGMIFNMLYNFGASILRSAGETKKPLYYLTIAGVANVILNLILVIGFKMDVAGVALGTILSQAISSILIVLCLMKRTDSVKLELKKLKINLNCLGEMVLIGLPAGIQGSLFSISNVFIQSAVNSFDSALIVSGNTAASNIEGFVWTAMNGFYQACITFSSRNFGAGKIKNCKKVLYYCLLCVVVTGLFLGISGLVFSDQLLSIYLNNVDAIDVGKNRMAIIMTTYFICGVMDVLVGGLRGLGYSIVPMIVSVLGVCGFRLVWIFTIFEYHHTLENLYVSYPISWFFTGLIHAVSYFIVYKMVKRRFINKGKIIE
mgnify:FL=1